jgi:hypothetical protein
LRVKLECFLLSDKEVDVRRCGILLRQDNDRLGVEIFEARTVINFETGVALQMCFNRVRPVIN